jgi:hypothetical protein
MYSGEEEKTASSRGKINNSFLVAPRKSQAALKFKIQSFKTSASHQK